MIRALADAGGNFLNAQESRFQEFARTLQAQILMISGYRFPGFRFKEPAQVRG